MSFDTNSNDLLTQLKAGETEVFNAIYRMYFSRLYHFVNSYLNNNENSRDIVQNVFTKLWQNKDRLEENSNLGGWLFTTAKNEALSFHKHRVVEGRHFQQERERLLHNNILALNKVQSSEATYSEIIQIVQSTLEKLPGHCRLVFICSRYRMMSNKEIADFLSISVKTVESHMTRALKILRSALSDYI